MKLDLDSLFTLFEELDTSELESLKEQLTVNAELVLKLLIPKIEITGKTIGNQEVLNKFISGVPGTTVSDKLNQLNVALTQAGKIDKRGKNLSLLTEKIAILDALNRMFNEFDASPAGFLNETFLAAFFPGGTKISAEVANSQNLITDVRGDKEYSIKTLTKGSEIGGSAYNLCNTVYHHGEVVFLVFYKKFEGSGEGKKVGSYVMYEYSVTKNNLSEIKLKDSNMTAADYYEKYKHTFEKGSKPLQEKELQASPSELAAGAPNIKQKQPEAIQKSKFIIPKQFFAGEPAATVNFSTEQALEEIAESIGDALTRIKELHQDMQNLASALSKYFTSTNAQEKETLAQQMIGSSKQVDPKTKEIVKEE